MSGSTRPTEPPAGVRRNRSTDPVANLSYRATDSDAATIACRFWSECVALAVAVPLAGAEMSADEQVLVETD